MNRSSLLSGWWQQVVRFPWLSVGWLTIGTGLLLLCFMLWLSMQLAERMTVEVVTPAVSPMTEQNLELPDHIETEVGMLFEAVPALDLNKKIAVVGQRTAEFRGTEFIKANASHWTLQVMKVSQESVLKTYLSQRKDRQVFQYFRLVEGTQEHYLLTYGNFTTVQTAMGALRTVQFELPDSIKVFPERFSTYQSAVKDQGSEERTSGLAQKIRQILLKPVAIPVEIDPVERAARTAERAARASRSSAEPAFGAVAGDQVAAKIEPAISLPVSPAQATSRPAAKPAERSPAKPAEPAKPSEPAKPKPVVIAPSTPASNQDPFN